MAEPPGFEDEPAPDMGALLAQLKAHGLDPDAEDLALALPAILLVKRMEREVCRELHPPGAPDAT